VLTAVGEISSEAWSSRYEWMAARNDEYFVIVIEDEGGRVAAVGSLIVEGKLLVICSPPPFHCFSAGAHKDARARARGLLMVGQYP
jgi:hypothetical protein